MELSIENDIEAEINLLPTRENPIMVEIARSPRSRAVVRSPSTEEVFLKKHGHWDGRLQVKMFKTLSPNSSPDITRRPIAVKPDVQKSLSFSGLSTV